VSELFVSGFIAQSKLVLPLFPPLTNLQFKTPKVVNVLNLIILVKLYGFLLRASPGSLGGYFGNGLVTF